MIRIGTFLAFCLSISALAGPPLGIWESPIMDAAGVDEMILTLHITPDKTRWETYCSLKGGDVAWDSQTFETRTRGSSLVVSSRSTPAPAVCGLEFSSSQLPFSREGSQLVVEGVLGKTRVFHRGETLVSASDFKCEINPTQTVSPLDSVENFQIQMLGGLPPFRLIDSELSYRGDERGGQKVDPYAMPLKRHPGSGIVTHDNGAVLRRGFSLGPVRAGADSEYFENFPGVVTETLTFLDGIGQKTTCRYTVSLRPRFGR